MFEYTKCSQCLCRWWFFFRWGVTYSILVGFFGYVHLVNLVKITYLPKCLYVSMKLCFNLIVVLKQTLSEQYVDCKLVRPTSKTLHTWNSSLVRTVGEATLDVLNPRINEIHTTDFIVVPNGFSNLLGLPILVIMNSIHVNRDIFDIPSISEQDVIRTHPTVFVNTQGKLPGKTTLHMSESHKHYVPTTYRLQFEMKLNRDLIAWWKRMSWPLWLNQRTGSVRWQWLGRKMALCMSALTLHSSISL